MCFRLLVEEQLLLVVLNEVHIKRGTDIEIVGINDVSIKTTVMGIEMFKKELDEAMAGDTLGLLLRGLRWHQLHRGMVVAVPGTVKPSKKFLGSFYI